MPGCPLAGVAPFKHDSGQFAGSATSSEARSSPLGPLYGRPCRLAPQPYPQTALTSASSIVAKQETRPHALMRKLIVLTNHLLKHPEFTLAI